VRKSSKCLNWLILLTGMFALIQPASASGLCSARVELLAGGRLVAHASDTGQGRDTGRVLFETQLPATNERHDREYAPALHFSDGTVAVFTQSVRKSLGEDQASSDTPCYVAAGNDFVIGPGQTKLVDMSRPTVPGYVAFGRPKVISHGGVTFVVDRKLPQWALKYIMEETDRAVLAYAEHLHKRSVPLVMIYASPGESPYFWGDHLDGTLTLGLYGDWRNDTPDLQAQLHQFIAHELFHVWNTSGGHQADPTSLLALEGGAELAKVLMTFDRTHDATLVLNDVSDAMTRCQLEQAPPSKLRELLANPRPGRLPYDCGMLLMFLQTVRPDGSTLDDKGFWRFWKHPPPQDGRVDKILDAEAFDVAARDAIRASGYQVAERRGLPPDLASFAGKQILMALMSADCTGSYGFFSMREGYRLQDDLPTCGNFKGGKTVLEIAGMKPWVDPIALDARVQELCAAGKPVPVAYADPDPPSLIPCDHKVKSLAFSRISLGGTGGLAGRAPQD